MTASGADLPTPELPATEPSAPRTVASPGLQAVARIADVGLRVLAGVVATLLAVLLALAEGFLLPTRILDIPAPVASFVLVVAGNAALIRFAYQATGSGLGMVGPCVAWLGTMLVLGSRTDEGDLVLPGDWRALLLFFGGTAVLVVAGFLAVIPRAGTPRTRTARTRTPRTGAPGAGAPGAGAPGAGAPGAVAPGTAPPTRSVAEKP